MLVKVATKYANCNGEAYMVSRTVEVISFFLASNAFNVFYHAK
jgi:hypothetical protein